MCEALICTDAWVSSVQMLGGNMDGCASLLREWGFYAIIVMTFGNGNFLRVHNDAARLETSVFPSIIPR